MTVVLLEGCFKSFQLEKNVNFNHIIHVKNHVDKYVCKENVELVHAPPLTPHSCRPQAERPPPWLQITSNVLVFYGLSHGITFEKNGMAQNLIYSKI